jgi:predicted DNA-binding transcriptional regulator AlpA
MITTAEMAPAAPDWPDSPNMLLRLDSMKAAKLNAERETAPLSSVPPGFESELAMGDLRINQSADGRRQPEPENTSIDRPLLLSAQQAAELVGISTSSLWRVLSAGKFPQPVHPLPSLTKWRRSDVEAYVAALPQSDSRRLRVRRTAAEDHTTSQSES